MELRGKRVLVTGASRGIGRSLATAFAEAGRRRWRWWRATAPPSTSLATELGGTAHPADLLDPEQRNRLVHRVEDEAGPDRRAGEQRRAGPRRAAVGEHRRAASTRQIQLNLTTPLELCRQAMPRMLRRGGGHLVNVASLAALASVPGMTTYAATKAGLAHGTARPARRAEGPARSA